jgi:hypothetical protein
MSRVTLGGIEGNTGSFEDPDYVQAIDFIAHRKGKHGKIGKRPLRLDTDGERRTRRVFLLPESPLADHAGIAIQQTVDSVNAQAGHADVIGIGVDKCDGEPAPPVFDNRAMFSRKPLPCLSDALPAHGTIQSASIITSSSP